ncbi:MAG: PspC domain-containing protein [Alistipes sp.]|nr:PspC domain-containing protein [Alistipes sp.]
MERRLRRSRYNRIVAGVCGGLGNYMGLDPVVVRLAVVLLMLFAGMSLWVYIIMWLLIPEE